MTEVDLSLLTTEEFSDFINSLPKDSVLETGEYGLLLIARFMKELIDFEIVNHTIENQTKSNTTAKQFIKFSNKNNKIITFQHNENFDEKINVNKRTGLPEKTTKLILINI